MTDSPSDLLAFIPVVRKIKRPDGWTPELQREFIRRVALNGSPQQTCTEMGKHVTGVEALYKVPGADSFRAAWDEAVRIGRTAQGLDCGPPHLGPVPGIARRPTRIPGAHADHAGGADTEEEMAGEDKLALLESIFRKFMRKVEAEREARLGGEVVAADFYLRQVTACEVILDMMAEGLGTNAWAVMSDLRRGGHGVMQVAETPMSRILDDARRAIWAQMAEPARPEHPPRRYLEEQDGYSTEPVDYLRGGTDKEREAQIAAREKQHREDAAAQVEWEASRAVSPGD